MCDFLHLILVQYDLGLEKQAGNRFGHFWPFMGHLWPFGPNLADFGGLYTYLAKFVTFVLNMLET